MALILPAYAKLNLTLDVTGRRPDGYHEIDSVMQTISLHDLIWIARTDCRVFDVVGPAIDGENLVLKAARELEGHVGRALPFTIRLFKRVPMGAGLGGGSADAAAFLKSANLLYNLKLKPSELVRIAAAVGQDVPFFLSGGTARASGLGSTLSPLPALSASWHFLVVCPPLQIPTRAVYEAVDGSGPGGHRTPALVAALTNPPPRPSRARGEGEDPEWGREMKTTASGGGDYGHFFGNDLESASRGLFPQLAETLAALAAIVPRLTMTGTGAAFFAPVADKREGQKLLGTVRALGIPAWLCRPIPSAA